MGRGGAGESAATESVRSHLTHSATTLIVRRQYRSDAASLWVAHGLAAFFLAREVWPRNLRPREDQHEVRRQFVLPRHAGASLFKVPTHGSQAPRSVPYELSCDWGGHQWPERTPVARLSAFRRQVQPAEARRGGEPSMGLCSAPAIPDHVSLHHKAVATVLRVFADVGHRLRLANLGLPLMSPPQGRSPR